MYNMNIASTKLFSNENLEILQNLSKSYPNDFDLGKQVRKLFITDTFVKSLGNDQDLGKEIRKTIRIFSK
jgi:hypothetical protein